MGYVQTAGGKLTGNLGKPFFKALAIVLVAGCTFGQASSGEAKRDVDWPAYNGSYANTHYSNLAQINVANVSKLREA